MTTTNADNNARFVQEWREWAGWERFLTAPFGWLAATASNWVDEEPRQYPDLPGLWWQEGKKLFVDPQGRTMSYEGESFTEVCGLDLSEAPDDVRITMRRCRDRSHLPGSVPGRDVRPASSRRVTTSAVCRSTSPTLALY